MSKFDAAISTLKSTLGDVDEYGVVGQEADETEAAIRVLEAAAKTDNKTLMRLCEDYKMPFSIGKIFYDAGFIDGHRAALPDDTDAKEKP